MKKILELRSSGNRKCYGQAPSFGDAVFLRLASLYLGVDIIIIPAFRESAENRTLGFTVMRAERKVSSEPLYIFYYSDSDFKTPHFQSVRPATDDNILSGLCQDGVSTELEPCIMQSTGVSDQIQPSFQFPDGSNVLSQDLDFVFDR